MFKLRGFTLIEAMVVVAIVAVLVCIAAPSFKNQIQ
jgi:prepilin-type N-terminal cleavage/methylation domain-containing protein